MKAGLDIGNSRSKLGFFHENGKIEIKEIERSVGGLIKEMEIANIKHLIVSSVTQQLIDEEELIKKLDSFIWLSDSTPLPIKIDYHTPETLGRDRIATAVAAATQFPEENIVVVDAGTCITVDFIKKGKIFEGGYIAPGIKMRWNAMHTFTSNLPLVDSCPNTIVGKTTIEALGIGGGMTVVMELEGYLQRMKEKHKLINVILTGGDGTFISENIVSRIHLCPNLLMEGLMEIQKYNAQ